MIIGITGSHRVGKTTLAKELAKRFNFEFVQTNISSFPVWRKAKLSPSDHLTFAERLKVQTEIFSYSKQTLFTKITKSSNAVVDRTYFDYLAYLLANVDDTTSDLFTEEFNWLVEKCITNQRNFFDFTVVIQPGIEIIEENGKSGKVFLSKPYMYVLNNHIISLCYQHLEPNKFIIIPKDILGIQERVIYVFEKLLLHFPNMPLMNSAKYV